MAKTRVKEKSSAIGKKAPSKVAGAATRKKTARRRAGSLAPSKVQRGPGSAEIDLPLDDAAIAPLALEVHARGGTALGAYREPLRGSPILLATLPLDAVQPTPFQRDLSPTHTKRLAAKIDECGAYLDPLIVVRGADGKLWTPNGRHRLAAAKVLGLRQITVLISPDPALAFKILALNTEKAHNLEDRSLEVIRMARALERCEPRRPESAFTTEFEAPEFLTLGMVYEKEGRFAGGAYGPFLKKVDRFLDRPLSASLREREKYRARLIEIDAQVKELVKALQAKGMRSPYLRNYVVARINPVRFHRAKKGDTKPPMEVAAALTRMAAAARKFDVASVKAADLALVAALAPGD